MKILIISNMYPNKKHVNYGIFVRNFKDDLENNSIETELVAIKGKGKTIFQKLYKYIVFITSSMFKILQNKYDLIYIHYAQHSVFPLALVQKFKKIKKPIVINAHGDDVFDDGLISKFVCDSIKNAELIVVPSPYFKNIVFKKYKNSSIFISPSGGIDTKLFRPKSDFLNYKKQEILQLGYVSRIDEGKGWDTLLEAIYRLIQEYNFNSFHLTVAGHGKDEGNFKNKVKEFNLEKYVNYIGLKKQAELPIVYQNLDLFIFPSFRESLGLCGLEAMACGIPVLGSNIAGIASYITDGYNGLLFTPKDEIDLSNKIIDFNHLNNDKIIELKKNAISTAIKYDSKKIGKELLSKLKETYNEYNHG